MPQPRQLPSTPHGHANGSNGYATAGQGSSAIIHVPLPVKKLSNRLPSESDKQPVVLVNCGSFNPPTIMHLRMFDVAAQVLRKVIAGLHDGSLNVLHRQTWGAALNYIKPCPMKLSASLLGNSSQMHIDALCSLFSYLWCMSVPSDNIILMQADLLRMWCLQAGHDVIGGYASPVNDSYHKPGLLSSQHRIAMCQLAAAESDLVMVDTWEAAQAEAQRSLVVLQRVQRAMREHYQPHMSEASSSFQQASKESSHSAEHVKSTSNRDQTYRHSSIASVGNFQNHDDNFTF